MAKLMADVRELVDDVVSDGKLTFEEQVMLNELLWLDGKLDEAERAQLKRLATLVEEGKLEVVD